MRKTAKKLRKRKEDGDVRKTWGEWKRDTENEKNVVEAGQKWGQWKRERKGRG